MLIRQPATGYRAGADPVFLAAAVPAKRGDHVLEFGCGVGIALLCLGNRVGDAHLIGVEIDRPTAELAAFNAQTNSIALEVFVASVAELPREVTDRVYDHVMMNPPYFEDGSGTLPVEDGNALGRYERIPLGIWIDAWT